MEIERAQLEDLDEILKLQKVCFLENAIRYNNMNVQPMTQTLDELVDEYNKSSVLKIKNDGVIIGSIRASKDGAACHVGKLIVHPDWQNRGLGSRLLTTIETEFSDVSCYELFTGGLDEKNIYFYEKYGYVEYKRKRVTELLEFVFMRKVGKPGLIN